MGYVSDAEKEYWARMEEYKKNPANLTDSQSRELENYDAPINRSFREDQINRDDSKQGKSKGIIAGLKEAISKLWKSKKESPSVSGKLADKSQGDKSFNPGSATVSTAIKKAVSRGDLQPSRWIKKKK